MSWTYKSLKDYDEPPEWLLEERDRQRELMREHRANMGKRARSAFDAYAAKALTELPRAWPGFYYGWRVIADPVFGNLYLTKWCIEQLVRLGYAVHGNNCSERTRVRVIGPNGFPAHDENGRKLYEYVRGPKVDTRVITAPQHSIP